MIDVHLPEELLPHSGSAELSERLTHAVLRWEGNPVAPPCSEHTAAFVHELPQGCVHTAAREGGWVVAGFALGDAESAALRGS